MDHSDILSPVTLSQNPTIPEISGYFLASGKRLQISFKKNKRKIYSMHLSSYQKALLQGSPDSLIYSRSFGQWTEINLRSSWLSPAMTQVKSCFAELSAFWLYRSSINLVDCPKISPPKISVFQNLLITTQPPSSPQPVTAMGPAFLSVMCVAIWFQPPRTSSSLF